MAPESIHSQRVEGVEMIVAIDSTARGPALGGCRWRRYASLDRARDDVVALSRAMTRKAAMARLDLGGGKAVVNGDPTERTRAQLEAFGELVQSLEGRYITAADMGTGQDAMAVIAGRTEHVIGLPSDLGGCGDPGPYTALGVLAGMEACLAERRLALAGATIAVQGAGNVGHELARLLLERGARVLAADTRRDALERLPAEVTRVAPDELLRAECDVLAPCGPPAVIDLEGVAELRCSIVCGAANNPLTGAAAAVALHKRGILYAPDFIANAGGLIHLAVARAGGDARASRERLAVIPENLVRVFEASRAEDVDPAAIAERLAAAQLG